MQKLDLSEAMDSMAAYDLDASFEPQQRARSNTWPCPPRPDTFADSGGASCKETDSAAGTPPQQSCILSGGTQSSQALLTGLQPGAKKNSSRRNAWGNLSYADLITQAITSAPDKRLTLSQIYEWMVQNVPYFKDKGDSNSSAGWKNSIRHNLSLHNRFMRVQNEGTGKSSWWMINPDAKPGKSARRRATSMETSKFEKRRGRVKKKVEALRNGLLQADATPSPSSSVSEGLDQFPDSPLHHASSFQLSPDFRPRASSNASSCGRLSPIPAILGEPEWTPNYASTYSPEQLAGSLAETMKLVPGYPVYQNSPSSQQQQQQPQQQQAQQPQQLQQQSQTQTQQQQQQSGPPPPSYYEAQFQRNNALRTSPFGLPPTPQSNPQQRCPVHHIQQCGCQMQSANLVSSMSPPYQQSEPSPASLGSQSVQQYLMQQQQQQQIDQQQQQQQSHQVQQSQQTTQQQQQTPQSATTTPVIKQELDDSRPGSPIPSTMMGQLMGALNNTALLDDLNINIEGLSSFGDCDIDEVIKHELQINGTLDINFGQQNSNAGAMTGLGGGGIISGANGGGIPLGGNLPLSDNQLLVNNDQHNNHMHHHSHHQHMHPNHHHHHHHHHLHHHQMMGSGANVVAGSNAASAAAVFASTNAATPAAAAAATASPSWVH